MAAEEIDVINKRAKNQKAIIFVIVWILALIFVYPLFLIVMNSVKPLAQILTKPLSWPDVFQIENYVKAFKEVNVWYNMKNKDYGVPRSEILVTKTPSITSK